MSVEGGFSGPQENESNSSNKDSSKKKEGFLAGYFNRKNEEPEHIEIPPVPAMFEKKDDEEEDESGLSSRLEKLFKLKVGDAVETEEVQDASETEEEEEPAEVEEPTIEDEPEVVEAAPETPIEQPVEAIEPEPDEIPEDDPMTQELALEDEIEQPIEQEPDEPEHTEPEPPESEPETPVPDIDEEEDEPTPPAPPRSTAPAGGSGAGTPPLPPIPQIGSTPNIPQPSVEMPAPEVIINNRGHGADVLLGAGLVYEHLRTSKKSRESEARDKAQQEQLDALKAQQERQALEREQGLNRLVEANALREQIEQDRIERQVAEAVEKQAKQAAEKSEKPTIEKPDETVVEVPESDVKPEKQPEKTKSVGEIIAERQPIVDKAPEVRPQTTPEIIMDSPNVTRLNPEEILKPDLKEKDSELILQQTEAAAEQGIALENQYELRHEVKDVASNTPGGVSAAMARFGQTDDPSTRQMYQQLQQNPALTEEMRKAQATLKDQSSSMYRQAVWAGFWGGAIILIGLAVIAIST